MICYNCYYEKVGNKTTCIDDEIPFGIPSNWTWTRLCNVGFWKAGSTPLRSTPKYYGGQIAWLKTGELNEGIIAKTEETITDLALEECSLHLNPIGAVLIAMYGATIGKLGIAGIELCTNQACCACTTNDLVFNQYLFFYLKAIKNQLISKSAGGAQPNISREILVNTLIALPPKKEQFKIVKQLEFFLHKTDEINHQYDEIKKLIYSFREKILDDIFGENSRYKSYYTQEKEKLGNIASLITKGSTPTSYGFQYVDKGISFVKVENVHDYNIDHTTIRQFITEDAHEFQKRSQLQKNDMLFSIAGTIGRICLVKNEDLPANTNQAFAIIRGYDEILTPAYLKWYLTWYLNDKSKLSGHGGGMLNITLNDLKKLEVFYPPNKKGQLAIVDRIENLMNTLCRIS